MLTVFAIYCVGLGGSISFTFMRSCAASVEELVTELLDVISLSGG